MNAKGCESSDGKFEGIVCICASRASFWTVLASASVFPPSPLVNHGVFALSLGQSTPDFWQSHVLHLLPIARRLAEKGQASQTSAPSPSSTPGRWEGASVGWVALERGMAVLEGCGRCWFCLPG